MNFKSLTEYLKLENSEFLFQFQSHPSFPSALAFSDTLNFFGVKNDAYELEKEYWGELPDEFITINNNNFVLIKKENQNFKVFSEDVKMISKEELYNNSTDFVILYEKEEQTITKNTLNNKNWVSVIMVFLLLYSLFQQNWYESVFNLLSIVGIYVSLELFNKKLGKTSVVLNNICGGETTNSQTNCSKIIDSDKINVVGLKTSDFSLVYFVGMLLIGVFLPATALILKVITVISVLVILYSLFIQIFVEKALCKICLVIITILLLQIVFAQFYFFAVLSLNTVILSILAFVISFVGLAFINDILSQKEEFRKSNLKNLKFKRNFDLFKRELLLSEKINFKSNESGFFIGKRNAKLHISLISNPYCGFCKDAHKIVEELLQKYPNEISAQIRFNYARNNSDEDFTGLIRIFNNLYSYSQDKFLEAVHYWFQVKDYNSFKNIFKNRNEYSIPLFLTEMTDENIQLGFNFTPVILINGHQFPLSYDREDIYYFINDLIEDDEI